MHRSIILLSILTALAWAGTKPLPDPGARYPVPLSPWEAHRAVALQMDIVARAKERVLAGHGDINDYIMLRFDLPPDRVTDEDLSEARRVLLQSVRERIIR